MATFPERLLGLVHAALGGLFGVLFAVLSLLPPLVGVLTLAIVTGMVMLVVVGRTSNQPGMLAAKRAMQAGLFEVRLFNDDLPAVLRALADLLRGNLRYLGLSLVPLAWMALPLTLAIAHLQAYYGYDGLVPGEPALLTVDLTEGAARLADPPVLVAPPGVRVDTPAVRLAGSRQVVWRLVPTMPGSTTMTLSLSGQSASLPVRVGAGAPSPLSPVRVRRGLLDLLLYPGAPLPEDGPFDRIELRYPDAALDIAGWRVHWLIVFVAASMASAFLLARRFGVVI